MKNQIWQDIQNFENKYQISINGNIRSLNYNNTNTTKLLKPKINKQGYLEVTLNKENKHYYKIVSRLVIETFTDIELSKNDIIMYKDNDKTNCALNNLYLISRGRKQEITYELDHRYRPKYDYYGQLLSTKEIALKNNIEPELIRNRVQVLKWNIYEAAEIPKSLMNIKNNRRSKKNETNL